VVPGIAWPVSIPTGSRLRVVIEPIDESATDTLDWPLTDAERAIRDDLPEFRPAHPMRLGTHEVASCQSDCPNVEHILCAKRRTSA